MEPFVDGTEVAAIDLGSNSFHMVVGRLESGHVQLIDRQREGVRLASGLDTRGFLSDEAQARALNCLSRFGQRVRDMPPETVRAVATNTLRKARNGRAFVAEAQAHLGHPVEIISGREEARIIYLGVAQSISDHPGRRLVVDIGGGSTECIVGEHFEIHEADSLYMGCVGFSRRFFGEGRLSKEAFARAEIASEMELESIARRYRTLGWKKAVGCSGTVHAVRKILSANNWESGVITLKGLRKLRKALIAVGSIDALSMPGLEADRRPVIAGGVAILCAIFHILGLETMEASPGALREGLLYDLVGRIRHEDVRERTIRVFQERYRIDLEQAVRVERTAVDCLSQVAKTWGLHGETPYQLLAWAARLHEVGVMVAFAGYHKHGAYLLHHADMPGFSQSTQNALSALVRAHRRRLKPELFADVPAHLATLTRQLCVLLRIAVSLHRSRSNGPVPIRIEASNATSLRLIVEASFLEAHPLTRALLRQQAEAVRSIGFQLELVA
jgi:exopolyphosphatase / guanosine-5'-triphosphate,3'-diphosphate pyrophosphatase